MCFKFLVRNLAETAVRMSETGGRAKRKNKSVFVTSHQKDNEDFPRKFPYWQLNYAEWVLLYAREKSDLVLLNQFNALSSPNH